SLRSKPVATPLAALARRLRARPWRARACRVSSGRFTWICPSLTSAVIRSGSDTFILPLGPSRATAPLAADVLLPGVGVAEDALAGGEDADAQAAEDRADLAHRHVAPEPRLADPAD